MFVVACSVFLLSCDRVLTPDQKTDIQAVKGGKYALDKDHASLIFKLNHLGFSTYVGRFNTLDAALDFDPEHIEKSSLEVIVDMASIDVNNPAFADQLRDSDWLDVKQFPQAVYKTTRYVGSTGGSTEKNTFAFEGDLTFHGVTKPVMLNVTFHGGGRNMLTRKNTLGFSAHATVKRSDFGVSKFTSMGVGDDIALEIDVEFKESKQ
ncbi:MAG TPA: YceI family protein [Steroidobacteraceae bacterium]|nr:YceI family protein [Steroidobacteraceae bacterium]